MESDGRGQKVPQADGAPVVEGVPAEIDCGRFPINRTVGEEVVVSAASFADGHNGTTTAAWTGT